MPKILVSDRGTEFANDLLKRLCKLMGTERKMTSSYHPQTNSSAESYNQSMIRYLRREFEVGDKVLVEFPGIPVGVNPKFYRTGQGLYTVTKKLGETNVKVKANNSAKIIRVHIDRVKHAVQEHVERFNDATKTVENKNNTTPVEVERRTKES